MTTEKEEPMNITATRISRPENGCDSCGFDHDPAIGCDDFAAEFAAEVRDGVA